MLSATATGLLLPLSFRGKPPVTFLQTGLKSGTPAACRRLLHTPRFVSALTRQFESPHVMLRAKAYLIAAAALESSSEVLVTVCEARLASCLERDLRMTNQHYTPKTPLDEDGVLIGSDDDVKTGGPNGDICSTTIAAAPGLQYLGVCVKHLSDFIVYSLIPNICKHVRRHGLLRNNSDLEMTNILLEHYRLLYQLERIPPLPLAKLPRAHRPRLNRTPAR